jgi:hypothetical protein
MIGGNSETHVLGETSITSENGYFVQSPNDIAILASGGAMLNGANVGITADGRIVIIGDRITIGANRNNFVEVTPSGVEIVGGVVKINCGGTTSGRSIFESWEQTDASKAEPREPTAADDAKSGQKSS